MVERYRVEPITEGRTAVRHGLAAETASYMRLLVPILRWRNAALFRKGLAGIENQVRKLRGEAA